MDHSRNILCKMKKMTKYDNVLHNIWIIIKSRNPLQCFSKHVNVDANAAALLALHFKRTLGNFL